MICKLRARILNVFKSWNVTVFSYKAGRICRMGKTRSKAADITLAISPSELYSVAECKTSRVVWLR